MKSDKNKKAPGGPKRGVRLNRPRDVRRLLARLINQALQKQIETDLLRAITYSCSMILKSLELSEFEERLSELETRLIHGFKK
jgi:hypothetical protein